MAVFGDLGGQPIELKNAAEESTLQRIASILESQGGGGSGAAGAQAADQKAKADRNAASAAQNLACDTQLKLATCSNVAVDIY